jgi:KaiC/GvpD/RAD55 family RecA-like ATPase
MKLSTGIPELDRLLGGGLPSDRSYMIAGPSRIGKRLLALTIQVSSLRRGGCCAYITYGQSYKVVMEYYREIGVEPLDYMKSEQLKIVDYYSPAYYSFDEIFRDSSPVEQKGVWWCRPESWETEGWDKHLTKVKNRINKFTPGVAIIDSLTDIFKLVNYETIVSHFHEMNDKITKRAHVCALLLCTLFDKQDLPTEAMLNRYADSRINMAFQPNGERKIQLKMKIPPAVDNAWHEFEIIDDQIFIDAAE